MKTGNKKAYYMISVVAEKYDLHPQTLRLYEREGLLKPERTEGNTRLYSDDDLETLEVILNLTRTLGVNLAGVEVVLNMRNKMEQMQTEVGQLIDFIKQEMSEKELKKTESSLVRVSSTQILKILRDRKTGSDNDNQEQTD